MTSLAVLQLSQLDNKVDRGPPGLWKVTEEVRGRPLCTTPMQICHWTHCKDALSPQVAATSAALKLSQAELKATNRSIELLERSLQDAQSQLLGQVESHKLLQIEGQDLNEKLVGAGMPGCCGGS